MNCSVNYNLNESVSQAKLQQEILDSRDQKHIAEVELLRAQLVEITEAREREMLSQKAVEEGIEKRFAMICEKSALLEEEIKEMELNAQAELARMSEKLAEVKERKEREIEELSCIVADKENELSEVRSEVSDNSWSLFIVRFDISRYSTNLIFLIINFLFTVATVDAHFERAPRSVVSSRGRA